MSSLGMAIHIPNQNDSFAGVSADPGMYEFPDYILLTTIVGRELIEIDDMKFATILRLSGNGIDLPAVGGCLAPSLLGPLRNPGWRERLVADEKSWESKAVSVVNL